MPRVQGKPLTEKQKRFIRRGLKSSRQTFVEIAMRAGTKPGTVSDWNARLGIRPPDVIEDIRAEHTVRRQTKKPVFHFGQGPEANLKKLAIIEKNRGAIFDVANIWWQNPAIQKIFPDQKNFFSALFRNAFTALDYYNPRVKGYKGKTKKVGNYLRDRTHLFCLKRASNYAKMEKAMPTGQEGSEMLFTEAAKVSVKKTKRKKASRFELARIPGKTKPILRKLGLDIDAIAITGWERTRDLLLKTARSADLEARELEFFGYRLEGDTLEVAGSKMLNLKDGSKGFSRERGRQLESRILAKLEKALKRRARRKTA